MIMAFVESSCLITVGLSLLGTRLSIHRLTLMSVVLLIATLSIRRIYYVYDITLGTHSFILLIIEVIIIVFIGKQSIIKGVMSSLLSYLVLIVIESIIICNLYYIFSVQPSFEYNDYFAKSIVSMVTNIPLLILLYYSYIKGFSIINLSKEAD